MILEAYKNRLKRANFIHRDKENIISFIKKY